MSEKAEQIIKEAGETLALRFEEEFEHHRAACGSPIEEIVLAALMANTAVPDCIEWKFFGKGSPSKHQSFWNQEFAYVYQQVRIGDYRADFLIVDCSVPFNLAKPRFMVIECDGHDFHEKTKEQARHDKRRDRYFQSQGIKVLRFTGSEIFNDPAAVADEIVGELQCDDDWRNRDRVR